MDSEAWRIIWFTLTVALASTALIFAPAVTSFPLAVRGARYRLKSG